MNLVKFKGYSKIYAIDTFEDEYKKLLKKTGEYNKCLNKLKFNLNFLEESESIETALLNKNIEKLKDSTNLYSIRNISSLNPRTIFCYLTEDNLYILLNSFLEKNSSDYNKGIKKAKNIIKHLGLH